MATHHWIIICGIKHHVQVGITAGCGRVDRVKEMRMVMLMKTITAVMILLMALRCQQERGGVVLPLVLPPSWPPPRWGEVPPLVLGLHGDDGPSEILLHGIQ